MVSLKEEAINYEPKKTKNITELEVVNINELQVFDGEGNDKEGKPFRYKYIVKDNEEYRGPPRVIENLQEILLIKPNTKFVKVTKTGDGMKTKYKVIQVD